MPSTSPWTKPADAFDRPRTWLCSGCGWRCVRVFALAAFIATVTTAQADVSGPRGTAVAGTGHPSGSRQPIKAALLERKRLEGRVRVRLLIFTRSIHKREGVRVWVFSNRLDRSAFARERPKCDCDGLWVVNRRTRRGRRLLRGLRRKMRETGEARFGTMARGDNPTGPGAGFRITEYNRKFQPVIASA